MSSNAFENNESSIARVPANESMNIDVSFFRGDPSSQRQMDNSLTVKNDSLNFSTQGLYGDSFGSGSASATNNFRGATESGIFKSASAPGASEIMQGRIFSAQNDMDMLREGSFVMPNNRSTGDSRFSPLMGDQSSKVSDIPFPFEGGFPVIDDGVGNPPAPYDKQNVSDKAGNPLAGAGDVAVRGVSSIVSSIEQRGVVPPDDPSRPEKATQPMPEIWERMADGSYQSMQQATDPGLNGNIYSKNADGSLTIKQSVSFDPYAEYQTGTTPGTTNLYYRSTDGNLRPLNAEVDVTTSQSAGHPPGAWQDLTYKAPADMAFVKQEFTQGNGTAADLPKMLQKVLVDGQIISRREAEYKGIVPGYKPRTVDPNPGDQPVPQPQPEVPQPQPEVPQPQPEVPQPQPEVPLPDFPMPELPEPLPELPLPEPEVPQPQPEVPQPQPEVPQPQPEVPQPQPEVPQPQPEVPQPQPEVPQPQPEVPQPQPEVPQPQPEVPQPQPEVPQPQPGHPRPGCDQRPQPLIRSEADFDKFNLNKDTNPADDTLTKSELTHGVVGNLLSSDRNDNGVLDRKEWMKVASSFGFNKDGARRAYNLANTDGEAGLSLAEMTALADKQIVSSMMAADRDNSGSVSRSEFRNLVPGRECQGKTGSDSGSDEGSGEGSSYSNLHNNHRRRAHTNSYQRPAW